MRIAMQAVGPLGVVERSRKAERRGEGPTFDFGSTRGPAVIVGLVGTPPIWLIGGLLPRRGMVFGQMLVLIPPQTLAA